MIITTEKSRMLLYQHGKKERKYKYTTWYSRAIDLLVGKSPPRGTLVWTYGPIYRKTMKTTICVINCNMYMCVVRKWSASV